jgi:hypothetical protein
MGIWVQEVASRCRGGGTLLAGFAFNFSKIFCDWVFVALILAETPGSIRQIGEGEVVGVVSPD